MRDALKEQSGRQVRHFPPATVVVTFIAITLVVLQTVQLFRTIDLFAVDVPFWDQWQFYTAFFEPHGLWEIFSWQHGPHRQGAGFFIIWAVNASTDWDQRAQAFTIGIVMTAAAAAFLWLKHRLFGALQWHDAIPVLMILSLKPQETYFNTPNVSHGALPLFLIIMLCLALTIKTAFPRYALVTVLYFLALFTGFAQLVLPILPVLLIIDCRHLLRNGQWKQACIAAAALICCLASIACFYHGYRFVSAADCFQFPDEHWYLYPVFMAIMFSTAVLPIKLVSLPSLAFGLFTITVLLCILIMVCMKLRTQNENYHRFQAVFLLIAFALVYSAATAVGRLCFGLEAATPSRYIPLLMPGFIGAYLFFLNFPGILNRRPVMIFIASATVFCLLNGLPWQQNSIAVHYYNRKKAWVTVFKKTHDSRLADTLSGNPVHPNPEHTKLARKLEWLRQNRYSLFRANASPGAPETSH
jgi:hypothetical protein